MSHKQNDIIREMAEEGHIKGREIKFRAWVAGWGMMFDVEAIDFEHGKVKVRNDYTLDSDVGRYKPGTEVKNYEEFGLEEVELMQFTGLKDKNGKEIYEGDIVKWQYFNETINRQVFFENGSFSVSLNEDGRNFVYPVYAYQHQDMEVIGNIHENPELLKEGI